MQKSKKETKEEESKSKVFGYVVGKAPAQQEYPADLPKNI